MNIQQLKEEKSCIKKELKSFEVLFQKTYGIQAGKSDKEPLRVLFQRYREAKALAEAKENEKSESPASSQSSVILQTSELNIKSSESKKRHLDGEWKNNEERESKRGNSKNLIKNKENEQGDKENQSLQIEYQQLKGEKRKLQVFLHEFQNNFVQIHGRNVETREDRKPVQKEYNRYQEIKGLIVELEKKLNLHSINK